jgi:adenylate cyclase
MERRLAALFSTDVQGYSRLMGDNEEATVQTLTAYRVLMTELIHQHRGRVVDSPGDNLLAEFASVVDAVQCAVAVQEALKGRNTELPPDRQMRFRIGINLGDVLVDGERIYGDGVNIAARMEGLAEGGGICLAGPAYDQVKNKLALEYVSLGEQVVKNIAEPVRAYRVVGKAETTGQSKPASHLTRASRRPVLVAIAMMLVLFVAGMIVWQVRQPPGPAMEVVSDVPVRTLTSGPAIAVLPFKNLSNNPEQAYFADGITDTIITDLSKLRNLFVIARNSTFIYKGKDVDVRQVSQELGVRYVLEGSVQRAGDQVRLNAQLIDATTGDHLWAERYDRSMHDIFAVQDALTRQIVTALDIELVEGEQARVWRKSTDNPKAYDYFLQGREHNLRLTKQDTARARELFEQALTLDPEFALAAAYLGLTYYLDVAFWGVSPAVSWEQTRVWANRAVELEASVGLPYTLLAFYYWRYIKDFGQATAHAERAIALNPSGATVHAMAAVVLIWTGKAERGLELIQKAFQLNPFSPPWYFAPLGIAYFFLGQYEKAIEAFEECSRRLPDFLVPRFMLAAVYGEVGREAEAREQAREVLRINPNTVQIKATASQKGRVGFGQLPCSGLLSRHFDIFRLTTRGLERWRRLGSLPSTTISSNKR